MPVVTDQQTERVARWGADAYAEARFGADVAGGVVRLRNVHDGTCEAETERMHHNGLMGIGADAAGDVFTVGGPLQPDLPSYVFRAADRELRARLREREFCHVLAPPQVGKTSLMAQTAFRLRADGCEIATLDLGEISGHGVAEDVGRWYYSFAYRVVRELRLRTSLTGWWQERAPLTIRQRLRDFFLEVVLAGSRRPVVIFLDRIEMVSRDAEARDLFEAIRGCLEARATEPEFRRLTFALLGTSGADRPLRQEPDGLFDVTTPVMLGDFSGHELGTLVQGLGLPAGATAALARRIGYWSAGHPYLSQKICLALVRNGIGRFDDAAVDDVVSLLFPRRNALRADAHLAALAGTLSQPRAASAARLTLYGRVRKGQRLAFDDGSTVQRELIDAGLLVEADGVLAVRNRIYANVFTALWVNRNLPIRWQAVAGALALLLVLLALPIAYRDYLPRPFVSVLEAERQDFILARRAWQRLRWLPGFRTDADRLFHDYLVRQSQHATQLAEVRRLAAELGELSRDPAQAAALLGEFQDRRASLMAEHGDRDGALLYTLEGLAQPTAAREQRLAELLGEDFPLLGATLRPGKPLVDLAIDPDSGHLTTLDRDHELIVWRIASGRADVEQRLRLAATAEGSALLGPGGRRALSWSSAEAGPRDVVVWDVAGSRVIARLPQPQGLRSARFTLGHAAVLLMGEREIEVRHATDGRPLLRLPAPADPRTSMALSDNGRFLLLGDSASAGAFARVLWDLDSLARVGRIITGSPTAPAAVDARGSRVAAGDGEHQVRIWRVRNPSLLAQCRLIAAPVALRFDPTGRYLVIEDDAGRLLIRDVDAGCRAITTRQGGDWKFQFSPDSSAVVIGNFSRGFELLRLPNGERIGPSLRPGTAGVIPDAAAARATGVRFLPDGKGLLTYDGRKAVKLWEIPLQDGAGFASPWSGAGPMAVSPDRRYLARATSGGAVRTVARSEDGSWPPLPAGESAASGHRPTVTRLAFAASGRLLASGAMDGSLRVWEMESGRPRDFRGMHEGGAVEDLGFLPDGSAVVSANRGSVLLVDARTGRTRARLAFATAEPHLAVSPDGAFVIVGGEHGALIRWDWRTGTVSTVGSTARPVRQLAISHDGRMLATADAGRVVRLWDLQTGRSQLHGFRYHAAIDGLAFSADDRSLAVRTGAWLHLFDAGGGRLVLRDTRALPDADAPILADRQGGWRMLSVGGDGASRLVAFDVNRSWASATALSRLPASEEIRARLRLVVDEAGELQPK